MLTGLGCETARYQFSRNRYWRAPKLTGDGKQERDFVYVSDIVAAFIAGMDSKENLGGKAFNVGTGKGKDLNGIIEKLNMGLGTSVAPEHVGKAAGEVDRIVADTSLSRETLGFEAKVGLDKGLKLYLDWLRKAKR